MRGKTGMNLVAEKPGEEPENQHNWNGEDEGEDRGEDPEESPVAPTVPARFAEVPREQAVVATIGFPDDIEYVAEEGN